MAKKRFNFSSWASNAFNSIMDSVASRMSTTMSSMYSTVGSSNSKTSDYLNIYNRDPDTYYDIMEDYPFFNKLVSVYTNAMHEIIMDDAWKVSVPSDLKLEEKLNKAIQDFKLKSFVDENLKKIVKRGSFIGFLDNTQSSISDVVNPFRSKFISRHNKFLSMTTSESDLQIPFYEIYSYWYEIRESNKFTTTEIEEMNKNSSNENLNEMNELNKVVNPEIQSKDDEFVQKYKKSVEVDTVVFQGKSMFEEYLTDLFFLFMREYILNTLSMSDYVKSNIILATMTGSKYDNKKVSEIINSIESLINTDNINIMMSFSDPIQLINQINDKLINRSRVLPQIQDYSQLEEMKLPDIQAVLDKLREDIEKNKKDIEEKLSIPEDILNGIGSRWEVSAKYQDYMNNLSKLLSTISNSIKRFCQAWYYKTEGKYIELNLIDHKFDLDKFVSPYMNRSKLSVLNDRMKDITGVIETASSVLDNEAVDDKKFMEYFSTELKSADPTLEGIIKLDANLFKKDGESESSKHYQFSNKKDKVLKQLFEIKPVEQ